MNLNKLSQIVSILAFAAVPLAAYDLPDLSDGFTLPEVEEGPLGGGYPTFDVGTVNLYSGKLNVAIPLKTIGGRGAVGHTITLQINQTWTVDKEFGSSLIETPIPSAWSTTRAGYSPGVIEGRNAIKRISTGCSSLGKYDYSLARITFIGPGGGEVELRDKATNGEPFDQGGTSCTFIATNNRGKIFVSGDGSGITFVSTADIYDGTAPTFYPDGTLYMPNGNAYTVVDGLITQIRDANGNYLTLAYGDPNVPSGPTLITDSTGRGVTIAYNQLGFSGFTKTDSILWTGTTGWGGASPNGGVKVDVPRNYLSDVLASGSVAYTDDLFPELANHDEVLFNPLKVHQVFLPTPLGAHRKKYEFAYNKYGEIVKIILPTASIYGVRARVEYEWENGVTNSSHGGFSADRSALKRRVKEIRRYATETTTTIESKTTYAWATTADCQPLDSMDGTVVTVDTYEGASTVVSREKHYFCGVPGENPNETVVDYAWWKRGVHYKSEIYDGTTTLLSTQLNAWEQRPPNTGENAWWSGSVNGPEVPRMEPRSQSVTTTVNQGGPIVAKREFLYDQYNNQTDIYEYDWDDTTPIRRTHFEYETNSTYLDQPVHIRGLLTKQWICGPGSGACTDGSAAAKTEYVYDGESLQAAAQSTVVGHLGGSYKSLTAITKRGNLTKVRRWRNLPTSTWIESRVKYNVLGMPVEAIDPLGHSTTVSYNDNFETAPTGHILAYPTSTTRGGQTAETKYEYLLGKPTRFTDVNDVETAYEYGDILSRVTRIYRADNYSAVKSATRYTYHDYGTYTDHVWGFVRRDLNTYNDNAIKTTSYKDSMGRSMGTRSDDCTVSPVDYDGLGRVIKQGTPVLMTCSDPTSLSGGNLPPAVGSTYTEFQYDGLGRRKAVIQPGGAQTTFTFSGASSTLEDPGGKSRKATSNALGQLVELIEDPGGLNYITEYSYDPLGNLIQVHQKGNNSSDTQTRTFTYDSLGRLLSADNPEDVVVGSNSGRMNYVYDSDSKLTSTTDARGITTTYHYDSLDRLTKRTFSDSTPTEHNCYDGKVFDHSTNACVTPGTAIPFSVGMMTSAGVEGVGSMTTTEFDPLGRALSTSQKTWTGSAYNTYAFAYSYNFNDSITTMTYPSGRAIEYAYDSSGRPYSVGEDGGSSYVNSVSYAVHGGVAGKQLGNLLHEQYCYNTRLQRVAERLGDDATTTACAWDADDKLQLAFGFGSATTNNGNMAQQAIKASASHSWTQYYVYDDVSRLSMASENAAITGSSCPSGATWCQKYGYDHFGNQWISASLDTLHMATPTSSSAVDPDTNRLTSGTYDAAGNLTAQAYITTGGGSMAYDANNKMKSFTATGVSVTTNYAGGTRMRKVFNSETTIWVYDAMGRLAAEYRNGTGPGLSASTPDKEYIYLGGQLAAMVEDSEIYYRTTDHLGSTRVVTDSGGAVVRRQDFFPFGETIPASSSYGSRNNVVDDSVSTYNAALGMRQQFTGQQRDDETKVDYFWERCMIPALARFTAADPGNAGAMPLLPQSWNGYAYVNNNPLRYTDPTGAFIQIDPDEGNWWDWIERIKITFRFPDGSPTPEPGPDEIRKIIGDNMDPSQRAEETAKYIAAGGFDSKDCRDLLDEYINAQEVRMKKDDRDLRRQGRFTYFREHITVDELISNIMSAALEISNNGSIENGEGSNAFLNARLYPNAATEGVTTVGEWFVANPGALALSSANSSMIWIRGSAWNDDFFKDGIPTAVGKGTILHEILHKNYVTKFPMIHEDMGVLRGFGSQFASEKIAANCFNF